MTVVVFLFLAIFAVVLVIVEQYMLKKLEEHERDIIRLEEETQDIRDTIENLYTEFVGQSRHE